MTRGLTAGARKPPVIWLRPARFIRALSSKVLYKVVKIKKDCAPAKNQHPIYSRWHRRRGVTAEAGPNL